MRDITTMRDGQFKVYTLEHAVCNTRMQGLNRVNSYVSTVLYITSWRRPSTLSKRKKL